MSEFKKGDKVRVLRHRNAFGEVLSYLTAGKTYTLTNKIGGVKTDGTWEPWGVEEDVYWVRTDDVEALTRGPIRTVTRREIVPGVYGYLKWSASKDREVTLSIDSKPFTAIDLREAAHLFNQLAEVLEENSKAAA